MIACSRQAEYPLPSIVMWGKRPNAVPICSGEIKQFYIPSTTPYSHTPIQIAAYANSPEKAHNYIPTFRNARTYTHKHSSTYTNTFVYTQTKTNIRAPRMHTHTHTHVYILYTIPCISTHHRPHMYTGTHM